MTATLAQNWTKDDYPTAVGASINGWFCGCGAYVINGLTHLCPPPVYAAPTPHKCPCCDGFGRRDVTPQFSSGQQLETCRACSGTGVLWK